MANASASGTIVADGIAYNYPSFTYEPAGQNLELIISGTSLVFPDVPEESIIKLREEDGYELRSLIDTPEKRFVVADKVLWYAQCFNMSILSHLNHTEIEDRLAEEAETHNNEIAFSTRDSGIDEEIYGTFKYPIVRGDGYILGLDPANETIKLFLFDGRQFLTRESCINYANGINFVAEQNGLRARGDLWGNLMLAADDIRHLQPDATEMNDDLIAAKEVALWFPSK